MNQAGVCVAVKFLSNPLGLVNEIKFLKNLISPIS